MATHRREHPPDPRVAKRLKAILAYYDIKPIRLAEKIGVDRASVSQWLNEETALTDKNAHRIAKALGEDPDFVLCRKDTGSKGYGAALNALGELIGGELVRDLLEMDPDKVRAAMRELVKSEKGSVS